MGRDEFMFVLNPDASPAEQVIVTVVGKKSFCIDPNRTPLVRQLCTSGLTDAGLSGHKPSLIADRASVNWTYVDRVQSGSDIVSVIVAHCSGDRPGKGLCQSDATVDDVVYTVGFAENLLPQLLVLHQEIRDRLAAWRLN
jgi:hypothetical protein